MFRHTTAAHACATAWAAAQAIAAEAGAADRERMLTQEKVSARAPHAVFAGAPS